MALEPGRLRRVDGRGQPAVATEFAGRRVHAVAGIGNPHRFFAQLRALGIVPVEHPFPDHHRFEAGDLVFGDDLPVLMTEKDAVKCTAFADERCWYLPVVARLDPNLVPRIEETLRGSQAA
jgi:tetraacyldisaccharide 4'-kinase